MTTEEHGSVRYSVKELLDQMRQENRESHRELVRKIDGVKRDVRELGRRVEVLEDEQIRHNAVSTIGARAWMAMIAALGVVVNIPAMLYFIHGAG